MREEFRTQQPQLTHLTTIGESVLSRAPSSDVQGKLSRVNAQWADLLSRLDERLTSLGAAADTSREFDAGLSRLRDTLQGISDQLDDIPLDREPEEQLRKVQVCGPSYFSVEIPAHYILNKISYLCYLD